MLKDKTILLVISGGIAAYKTLELIRRLRERGARVRPLLTAGGARFVTPLSVAALAEEKVYQDLFSLTDESEMGHIRLAREADLIVVAPASADLMAKMANGLADDLASTVLLATDRPVLIAPSMNVQMWAHRATRRNVARLAEDGVARIGPNAGDLACGEEGAGRMAEPGEILAAIERHFHETSDGPLKGLRALVTSGPTREPIDPARYLTNRSSGKQGHAIAAALDTLGAEVVLISGPVAETAPAGPMLKTVETAEEMLAACRAALPVDIAVCAAAVADWRPAAPSNQKIKRGDAPGRALDLVANPDILATLSGLKRGRPALVIGFAAETENVIEHARAKRASKGCDWIVANDVSPEAGTFGGDRNTVSIIDDAGVEAWPPASKREVARRLAERIATHIDAHGLSA